MAICICLCSLPGLIFTWKNHLFNELLQAPAWGSHRLPPEGSVYINHLEELQIANGGNTLFTVRIMVYGGGKLFQSLSGNFVKNNITLSKAAQFIIYKITSHFQRLHNLSVTCCIIWSLFIYTVCITCMCMFLVFISDFIPFIYNIDKYSMSLHLWSYHHQPSR